MESKHVNWQRRTLIRNARELSTSVHAFIEKSHDLLNDSKRMQTKSIHVKLKTGFLDKYINKSVE